MADNTVLNSGSGGDTIVTEQPGGVGPKIPVSKIYTGALDANGGPVTSTNPLDVRVGDATNTASVKAASTAAVAADKALVVAISPNNTVPVSGTFWQATQPVSGTITANIGTSGSLALDATLTGGTQRAKVTDGTNNAAVKAASTAAVAADTALVVALSPNNNTLANALFHKNTDGTNTAAVKAASTAAVAADPALVVAISPNNTVPVSAASLPLPTGAATSANQTTLGSSTTKINDGTNTAAVKAASTAAVAADPALVVSVSPNTLVNVYRATATAVQSSVAASATSVTVLASNTARRGAIIVNDSSSVAYVLFGSTASTTAFTVKMQPGDYYEVPFGYTGVIAGIWATATGSARVTEIS